MPNERPVEQPVRPGYWEHESGHVQEAWPDTPPDDVMRHRGWTPLYSQAALDDAVAAERERWEGPVARLWPLLHRLTKGLVFTAERAGEVQADLEALRVLLKA